MVEGPTIMLGVFITLLYAHTIPNIYYCSGYVVEFDTKKAEYYFELASIGGNVEARLALEGFEGFYTVINMERASKR